MNLENNEKSLKQLLNKFGVHTSTLTYMFSLIDRYGIEIVQKRIDKESSTGRLFTKKCIPRLCYSKQQNTLKLAGTIQGKLLRKQGETI
ncbi:hypothetical protein JOC28_001870 [Streptococcus loxodontisalivarius]|uniref:Transposase n=1 Tax=Streptococcus loxodontisalivarius TaxID=1349415 RepID=A0ABS2PU43_9STRE|nr:hypothetical protein [Streptococcus loxodontisalivarius]